MTNREKKRVERAIQRAEKLIDKLEKINKQIYKLKCGDFFLDCSFEDDAYSSVGIAILDLKEFVEWAQDILAGKRQFAKYKH